jgi:hypothetical protein
VAVAARVEDSEAASRVVMLSVSTGESVVVAAMVVVVVVVSDPSVEIATVVAVPVPVPGVSVDWSSISVVVGEATVVVVWDIVDS